MTNNKFLFLSFFPINEKERKKKKKTAAKQDTSTHIHISTYPYTITNTCTTDFNRHPKTYSNLISMAPMLFTSFLQHSDNLVRSGGWHVVNRESENVRASGSNS